MLCLCQLFVRGRSRAHVSRLHGLSWGSEYVAAMMLCLALTVSVSVRPMLHRSGCDTRLCQFHCHSHTITTTTNNNNISIIVDCLMSYVINILLCYSILYHVIFPITTQQSQPQRIKSCVHSTSSNTREFKDVVFEDVVFDSNSCVTLLYIVCYCNIHVKSIIIIIIIIIIIKHNILKHHIPELPKHTHDASSTSLESRCCCTRVRHAPKTLYYTILYYTILYYTILYYTILYYTTI